MKNTFFNLSWETVDIVDFDSSFCTIPLTTIHKFNSFHLCISIITVNQHSTTPVIICQISWNFYVSGYHTNCCSRINDAIWVAYCNLFCSKVFIKKRRSKIYRVANHICNGDFLSRILSRIGRSENNFVTNFPAKGRSNIYLSTPNSCNLLKNTPWRHWSWTI